MNFEVIIHGKPNSVSSKSTSDSALKEKIVSEFFESSHKLSEKETMIVDARFWKGVWNGVYTFVLSKGIKDTANRDSFLALTIIIPDKYCLLPREVFKTFQIVCDKVVKKYYLSTDCKYIVPNFDDKNAFEELCSVINSVWNNILADFDSDFKPCAINGFENICSLGDCDSLNILEILKTQGRFVITENAASLKVQINELSQMKPMLTAAQQKVSTLNNEIKNLKDQINSGHSSVLTKIKEKDKIINDLTQKNKTLETEKSELSEKVNSYIDKINEALKILNISSSEIIIPQPHPQPNKVNKFALEYLNTILLAVLVIIVVIFSLKMEHKPTPNEEENKTLVSKCDSLDAEINRLKKEKGKLIEYYDNKLLEITPSPVSPDITNEKASKKATPSDKDEDFEFKIWVNGNSVTATRENDDKQNWFVHIKENDVVKFSISSSVENIILKCQNDSLISEGIKLNTEFNSKFVDRDDKRGKKSIIIDSFSSNSKKTFRNRLVFKKKN